MNPLVSIIVPIYNAENYLEECIDSIQNQTYKDIQIILVNDGSTDKSLQICENFAIADSRILIINQKNSGVSSARNHGIDAAEGEYIGFVDSDDYLSIYMIEKLLSAIKLNNADLCALMNYTIKPANPKILNCVKLDKCEALRELFLLSFPSSLWAYLYKRDTLREIRLNDNIHFFEDFEFNYRVLASSKCVALSFENLYHYRVHDLSTNNQSINKKRMTCLEIFDLHKKDIYNSECNLTPYSNFFRSHFLISVILSISKSDKVNREYIRVTNLKWKEMLFDIIASKHVPIKYKIAIIIFIVNPSLLKFLL